MLFPCASVRFSMFLWSHAFILSKWWTDDGFGEICVKDFPMGPQMVISTYMMRLLRLNALHLTCVCLCSGGIDVCNLLNDGSLSIFLCPLQSITAYRLRWSAWQAKHRTFIEWGATKWCCMFSSKRFLTTQKPKVYWLVHVIMAICHCKNDQQWITFYWTSRLRFFWLVATNRWKLITELCNVTHVRVHSTVW